MDDTSGENGPSVQGNLFVRSTIIVVATLTAIFWLLFAVAQFPLIVPADHNSSTVEEFERASTAALWLFGLSLATVCLAAGFFGKKRMMHMLAFASLIAWIGVCPLLYPSMEILRFPYRLFAHVLSAALIVSSVIAVPRAANGVRAAAD